MFGIKNPAKMLGMLKMFGVKPDQLVLQLEGMALKKWKELEAEAGGKLTAVGVLDDSGQHFIVCLYKVKEDNQLELWKNFPLKNINAFLENFENGTNENTTGSIAEIGSSDFGGYEPGTGHA